MTIDEAFKTAIRLLNERKQLLNVDLYRLVEQDKDKFRQLRKSLIAEGFAEDQSGTSLKATKRAFQKRRDNQTDSVGSPPNTKQPNNDLTSVLSEAESEFGEPICFTEADFLPLRNEKRKVVPTDLPVSQIRPDHHEPVHREPEVQVPEEAPALVTLDLAEGGQSFVSLLKASRFTLLAMVFLAVLLAVTRIPWRASPDAHAVYQEFNQYYDQVKSLRTRATNAPVEWQRETSESRSRVQSILTAYKDARIGASSQQPAKQELLWAGKDSLLVLLESPEISKKEHEKLQLQFELHMREARRLLDGGTRTVSGKQTAPTNSVGAGKPPHLAK